MNSKNIQDKFSGRFIFLEGPDGCWKMRQLVGEDNFQLARRCFRKIIMWLPKKERKLLKSCYDKSKKVGETFEAPIYEMAKALGFKEKEASTQTTEAKWDMTFNAIKKLKVRELIHYEYEQEDMFRFKISLNLKGLDLGRKYSSKSHTILLWCNEYKIWVILSTIIGLAGIIISILVTILKD